MDDQNRLSFVESPAAVARRVFPFYVVCDVSRSMWDPEMNSGKAITPLDTVEQALPDMLRVLEDDPTTHDIAHLAIVAFGDSVEPVLPLTPLRDDPFIHGLPRQCATNFAAVFDYLRRQLPADYEWFMRNGLSTYTPAIFFLTDGNPQTNGQFQPPEAWHPLRLELEAPGFPFRPLVVALGIGNVSPDTVRLLRSTNPAGIACVAQDGAAPGDLLRAIIHSIKSSISSSVGQGEFVFRTPAGMTTLD